MRILLDECCHRRIVRALSGLDVNTVQTIGWSGLRNGDLLRRIEGRFEIFVTQDQNIARQNTIALLRFGVIVLRTKSGLETLMPQLREMIGGMRPGAVAVIGA